MLLLDALCEKNILEAEKQGLFDDLPGQGKPLELEDDSLIPEEYRAAYRLMKNSGLLPPEVSIRRDIAHIDSLISQCINSSEKQPLQRKKNRLLLQLGSMNPGSKLLMENDYLQKYAGR